MREGGVFEAPHRDAESDGARGGGMYHCRVQAVV